MLVLVDLLLRGWLEKSFQKTMPARMLHTSTMPCQMVILLMVVTDADRSPCLHLLALAWLLFLFLLWVNVLLVIKFVVIDWLSFIPTGQSTQKVDKWKSYWCAVF